MDCKLNKIFFQRDAATVARELLGKKIIRVFDNNNIKSFIITETEAYLGEQDLACHASKGKTQRTKIMYSRGGFIYVYLIYGIYWMLNFVTSSENNPQAVLIRSVQNCIGPGKVGRILQINKDFYGEDLSISKRIWVENYNIEKQDIIISKRVGVEYAGEYWAKQPLRFISSLQNNIIS